MDVQLPSGGCNILAGPDQVRHYSSDGRTRSTYYIYHGKAFLSETTTNNTGYTYTGECLTTGDLVYAPESEVYFTHLAILAIIFVFYLACRAFFRPWWRVMR